MNNHIYYAHIFLVNFIEYGNNSYITSSRLYLRSDIATCPLYNHFYKTNDDMANKNDDMAYN